MLYVADEPDERLEVLTRAAQEAGRRYPVIATTRDQVARQADHALHLGGVPATEIRALPMRFGAAVLCAGAAPDTLDEELAALSGKLLPDARLLLVDVRRGDAYDAQWIFGALSFSAGVGGSVLLAAPRPASRDVTQPDRRQRDEHRRSRVADLQRIRMHRDLDAVGRQARTAEERAAEPRDEVSRLSSRLEPNGARQAELEVDLTCASLEPALEELETLATRLMRTETRAAALTERLRRATGRPSIPASDLPVTVVIAIHNAFDELRRCIESVLAHTPEPHEVLLIDDASTDERVAPLLRQYAERSSQVTVLTNPENRGYTATINIGCDWAKGDVVLLNSDTEVPDGWFVGLRGVARSRQDVATVTPVSNAAGAFSLPERNADNALPEGLSLADMSALVAHLSPRARPRVPTGNGFCLYIRREALDRVGAFDEAAFPRGYGEENDFSQRAQAAGFVNLIDDATFVYHKRSASFAGDKTDLLAAAKAKLSEKHPGYPAAVKQFLADDPLLELRSAVADALHGGAEHVRRLPRSRPTILLVLHAGQGGTPETNRDMAGSLSSSFRCLTLSCALDQWRVTQVDGPDETELARYEFEQSWNVRVPLDAKRRETLHALLDVEAIDLVHVRSFIATGPELVGLVKDHGVPVVCSLHDFYTVCPTIQLVDEQEHYCAGHCTPGSGPCPTSKRWVGPQPDLKHGYVYRWRERMSRHLRSADAFVTTSHAAKSVLVDHFEFMDHGRFRIIEHGRDAESFRPLSAPPGARPRVVAFGALGASKGTTLLAELLRMDAREGPAFEFHFVGTRHTDFSPEALGGFVHGPYQRGELPRRLAEIRPSFALASSIWPETYCHTLTEAWLAELPVFASDIGTLRERVTRHGGGWLLDHTDPAAFYRGMRAVSESPVEWRLRRAEVAAMAPRTVDDMAADYRALYRELLRLPSTARGDLVP